MTPYRDAPRTPGDAVRVPLRWVPREQPLAVRGVAARGDVALRLAARLLALPDAALGAWRGVVAGDDLVLVGDDPPWVDGAVWLGRDADAPAWLLPTALRTDLPAALVLRALRGHGADPSLPHAAWPTADALRVVPVASARPLSRARLAAWAERPR